MFEPLLPPDTTMSDLVETITTEVEQASGTVQPEATV